MKKEMWTTPTLEEVSIANTQYGGKTYAKFDNIYQNDEGAWEGTYERTPEIPDSNS